MVGAKPGQVILGHIRKWAEQVSSSVSSVPASLFLSCLSSCLGFLQ